MMRGVKKLFCVLLCGLLLAGSLAFFGGCGKSKFTVLLMVNPEQDAFYKTYFAEQSEELGIDIDYVGYAWQDYYDQLKISMQDTPPDLFYIRPGDIKKLYKEGQLQNLSEYMSGAEFKKIADMDTLFSNVSDPYRYDGKTVGATGDDAGIYGVNLGFSYQGMGYNKKLVARKESIIKATKVNGVALVMPWELSVGESYTFDEFAKLLEICTDSEGGGLEGKDAVVGMNVPKDQFMPFVWANGGDIVSQDKESVTVDTPAFNAFLTFIKKGLDAKYISKEHTWGEWSNNKVAFFTEVGSWEVAGYELIDGFSYDMMPWPTVSGGDDWFGLIGTSAIAVSSKTSNKDAALKIAASFYSARTLDKMLKQGLVLPMVESVANGGYLTDSAYKPENKKIFIDVISGKNGKFSPINNTYNSEWYDSFTTNLDKVWNGKTDIADYLRSQQSSMQELYNRQKAMS